MQNPETIHSTTNQSEGVLDNRAYIQQTMIGRTNSGTDNITQISQIDNISNMQSVPNFIRASTPLDMTNSLLGGHEQSMTYQRGSELYCPYINHGCNEIFSNSNAIDKHLDVSFPKHIILQINTLTHVMNSVTQVINSIKFELSKIPGFEALKLNPTNINIINSNINSNNNSNNQSKSNNMDSNINSNINNNNNINNNVIQNGSSHIEMDNKSQLSYQPPPIIDPNPPQNNDVKQATPNNIVSSGHSNTMNGHSNVMNGRNNVINNVSNNIEPNGTPNSPEIRVKRNIYPCIIEVKGRKGFNSEMNGIYHLLPYLFKGKPAYKMDDKLWCIRWSSIRSSWFIDCDGLKDDDIACAKNNQNVSDPTKITKPWNVYSNPVYSLDTNIKIKTIVFGYNDAVEYRIKHGMKPVIEFERNTNTVFIPQQNQMDIPIPNEMQDQTYNQNYLIQMDDINQVMFGQNVLQTVSLQKSNEINNNINSNNINNNDNSKDKSIHNIPLSVISVTSNDDDMKEDIDLDPSKLSFSDIVSKKKKKKQSTSSSNNNNVSSHKQKNSKKKRKNRRNKHKKETKKKE